ncbi:MAG: BatA domain-containing protein [Flavobacteriales bacterium]|nr:BatA domain-containing protein [Flavobacteriales bacterium]
MQFLNPSILYALLAVAIPIIIHLFNFRRFKKVAFTNVKFLKEIKEQTRSKSKLKHLLILASRILAIVFLVLAFAQPFKPYSQNNAIDQQKNIGIYIDNSFSMNAEGNEGKLSDQAIKIAESLIKNLNANDEITLITNDFSNAQERPLNKSEALNQLEFIQESPAFRNFQEIKSRFLGLRGQKEGLSNELFVISDFQENFLSDTEQEDSLLRIKLIPLRANNNENIFIDSCWFSTPFRQLNNPEQLVIRIKNTSNNALKDLPIRLDINGVQKAIASTSVDANSSIDTSVSFTISEPGWQLGTVSINDHPITFDNDYFFSFEVKEKVRALCLYEQDSSIYLGSLFGKDPTVELDQVQISKVDYGAFSQQDLIILSGLSEIQSGLTQEIQKFVELGKTVLIIPSTTINLASYNNMASALNIDGFNGISKIERAVSELNLNLRLFEGIFESVPKNMDLPTVQTYYPRSSNLSADFDYVMKLENGDPFLNLYSKSNANIYVLYSPLSAEANNFAQHALFVPILYKVCYTSQLSGQMSYIVGEDQKIITSTKNTDKNVIKIKQVNKNYEFIPGNLFQGDKTALMIQGQIEESGHYNLKNNTDLGSVSFNYSRNESNTALISMEKIYEYVIDLSNIDVIELKDKNVELIGETLSRVVKGKNYWRYCLLISLVFFAFEIILIRLLS